MDDLRDALTAAYDKVEENTPDAGEAGAPERVEPEAREEAPQGEAADRTRDESGRFAKPEKADAADKPREKLTLKPKGEKDAAKEQERAQGQKAPAEQVAVGEQPAKVGDVQHQPGQPEQRGNPVPPPAHWLGDAKKHWDRLPAEVRKSIAADGQQAQQAQSLTQAIGPAAEVLTREFGGVDRGIGAVLGTWKFARENPIDFAKQFLQRYNIDPRTLSGGAPAPQPVETDADPVLAPVYERVQQLEARLQQVSQQPLIAYHNQIHTEVEAFGNAIAGDGKVAHPYFNDVRPVMAALMTSGQAKTLSDAYDMAVYANPQVRASLLAADQVKQADDRRRAAETARSAGATVTGAPGHRGPGTPQNETVGDTLSRAWEKAASGARA